MPLMKYTTQSDLKMGKCVSSHKRNSSGRVDPVVSLFHQRQRVFQRRHKERKLQANITVEHRCKNPQQNTSKQNLIAH